MITSVVSIIYVNDAPAAARFYGDLLGMSPSFETPGYITFDLGPGADFGLCQRPFVCPGGGQMFHALMADSASPVAARYLP
ncbi:VOC family protein, partial [Streptomyces sp. NPDC057623]|uniref:VOC family protein n=1 Tax=Streptomyces sp. NPDC057623 TaxID=3346187 RepID=UPI0036CC6956